MSGRPSKTKNASIFASLFRERYATVEKNLREVQKTFDEKSLHDFRVSLRRLEAFLVLAGNLLRAKKKSRKLHAALEDLRTVSKKALRSSSRLRDVQIFKSKLKESLPEAPFLLPLYEAMVVEEYKLAKKAQKKIDLMNLSPDRGSKIDSILEDFDSGADGRCFENEMTLLLQRRFAALDGAAKNLSLESAESFHHMRICLKKYRYALEIRSSASGEVYSGQIEILKGFQDFLGKIQDIEVMTDIMDAYCKKQAPPFELNLYYNQLLEIQKSLMDEFFLRAEELRAFQP